VASGVAANKIKLVPRAADKSSSAARIQAIVAAVNHNPAKFKKALEDHRSLANSWLNIGAAVTNSYKTALLMGIDLLIKEGVLETVAGQGLDGAPGDDLASEDTVARMAEYLSLLKEGRASAALSAAQRAKWRKIELALRNRMLPTPNPASAKYNVANEFGFRRNANGTYASKARINGTGAPKTDALGKLLSLSISHFPHMLQQLVVAVYSERKNALGVALTEPALEGTSLFQMYLQPHGGLCDVN